MTGDSGGKLFLIISGQLNPRAMPVYGKFRALPLIFYTSGSYTGFVRWIKTRSVSVCMFHHSGHGLYKKCECDLYFSSH